MHLFSHALHHVVLRCHDDRVKMAPHSDLVSCSVLRHCLMMIPISCVVLLQKAGFFFEPARATAPASVSLLGVAEPRPCAESVGVSSHRPPSGHPPEPALFPRALPASIDKEFDFATEAIGKLTGDGLGKWTATEWSYSLSTDVQTVSSSHRLHWRDLGREIGQGNAHRVHPTMTRQH